MLEFLETYWAYLIIPIVSAIVGWSTNVIALKMTFYPIEYFGFGPWIGWQGIIPSKASRMAERSVDLMLDKLIDMDEQFSRLDPHQIAELSKEELDRLSVKLLNKVMRAQAPILWATIPESMKSSIADGIASDLPLVVEEMMLDLRNHINEVFDVKSTVVKTLTEDKALLNEIFLRCGREEFKFIERSGLLFGFLFGLIQMVIWYYYQPWWLLPVAGLAVGYLTNLLALKMIFHPINPIKILGYTIQGLFIKRQQEVAKEYAEIVSDKILNTQNIFENILYGNKSEKLTEIIQRHIEKIIEQTSDKYKVFIAIFSNPEKLKQISNITNYYFLDHFPIIIHKISPYAENALRLEKTFEEKMAGLSPIEFQAFLRPVFQEDEMKLVAVGALLGAIAGLLQWYLLF